MKILIVSDAWLPQLNGVVRTYQHLNEELEKRGHETHVIGPSHFPRRISIPGYKEIELVIFPSRRLKKIISFHRPDHIHIATEGPLGAAARKYCLRNAHPFTTCYHTHFPDYLATRIARFLPFLYNPVRNIAIARMRRFHNPAHAMLVATKSLEHELKSWGFTVQIWRLTRGVANIFSPQGDKIMQDLPRPIALYVGRIAIEKNLEDFLSMDWEGSKIIIGHGPAARELQKKYPDAHFIGKKEGEELASYYRSADLFVFPSRTDTFGIVLIEAIASGLPVAAYDTTGPRDIINNPVLGAISKNDLSAAAAKALSTKASPQDRHQYARAHYSWPVAATQFLNAVETALIINKERN